MPDTTRTALRFGLLSVAIFLSLVACNKSNQLALTPTILRQNATGFTSDIPASLPASTPEIFYMTDRVAVDLPDGTRGYSHQRSDAMAFGSTRVKLGQGLGWPGLDDQSLVRAPNLLRSASVLTVTDTQEIIRFTPTPLPFELDHGRLRILPDAQAGYSAQRRIFQQQIKTALARTDRHEAVIFVHGFNNDFADATTTLASIWHFSGRIGVPIAYTWPAGSPGMFGYFTDRESGEFSIFHLKEFLRMLAEIPELDAIHLIAHSRGSDVATTALRELIIADRARGLSPRKTLKIDTLIMAAPDLDFGVVRQRLLAEQFGPAFGQINVYMNRKDSTLGLSEGMMRGLRFGRVTLADLAGTETEIFRRIKNVHFIDVEKISSGSGHAYFRENPAVISDIILALRTGALPGSTDRPLEPQGGNFWSLHPDYPFARIPIALGSTPAR